MTNGLAHAQKAAECGLESLCVGGCVSSSSRSTSGMFAEYVISQLHTDLCFFSVPHVSHDGRLWHYSANTVKILQLMMDNASRSVLLCNSQKIDDITETYLLGTTDTIDVIVSEQALSDDFPRRSDSITVFPEL